MAKKPQIDKFLETARDLECNEDEAEFNKALAEIAKAQQDPNADLGEAKPKPRGKKAAD